MKPCSSIFLLLCSVIGTTRSGHDIGQAISDMAQKKTIAFSALAFLTGDFCEATFFPPGKVSDFFGFQFLRDNTPNGFGHNTAYAGKLSDTVLSILTDAQVGDLINLANSQAGDVSDYGYKRFAAIDAFRRLLDGNIPAGTTGLDEAKVVDFFGDFTSQRDEMVQALNNFNAMFENATDGKIEEDEWPVVELVDVSALHNRSYKVLVSTYATQLLSWMEGSVEADTYFCPERHGTYFGSFYLKDIPPVRATSGPLTIDTEFTANAGQSLIDALDTTQAALITGLVDLQRSDMQGIVARRENISTLLRPMMNGASADNATLMDWVRDYGEYEGSMMYNYATNFAEVGQSLTAAQQTTLETLRTDYYDGFPDYQANSSVYDCSGAWLYVEEIASPTVDSDFLFA